VRYGLFRNLPYGRTVILLVSLDFLDPVSLLKVHQPISQTLENFCVSILPFLLRVLANQVEHCGKCAEAVVLLNMEL
jgi:hypothetical protein